MSINSLDGAILRWRDRRTNAAARLALAAAAAWRAMRARRQRRQTMGRLAALSDQTLKDLGVHRSEVCSIAYWNKSDRTRRRNLPAGGRFPG